MGSLYACVYVPLRESGQLHLRWTSLVSAHVPAIFRFICSSRPRKMGDLKPGWHFPCCPPLEHRCRMQDEMCQLAAGSRGGSLWQLDGNRAVVLISPSFGINPKRRELLQGKATQPCGHWIKEGMEEWSVRTEEGIIIVCTIEAAMASCSKSFVGLWCSMFALDLKENNLGPCCKYGLEIHVIHCLQFWYYART